VALLGLPDYRARLRVQSLPDAACLCVIRGIARDLTLALLEALARQRIHHLVGLGEPALARPAHPASATEFHQAIRSLH